jgi:hypothetical protein
MCSDPVRHIQRVHPVDADQDHTRCRVIGWRVDQRLRILLLSRTKPCYCADKGSAAKHTSRQVPLNSSEQELSLMQPWLLQLLGLAGI